MRPPPRGDTWIDGNLDEVQVPSVDATLIDLGTIGTGGSGEVRRVRDGALCRNLALKRLRPDLRSSTGHLARFLGEARLTASLDHPGVVPVHALAIDDDGPYYTMKEVRGRTLAEAVAAGEPVERLLEAFRRACETVAFAHAQGVWHCDLKPHNVMLGEYGEVYVLDWGPVLGTPGYMSPERVAGGAIDARSDVWSLGVMLRDVLARDPAGIPPEVGAILRRALQPRPEERYADAGELTADVAAWLAGAPVRAYRYGVGDVIRRFVAAHRAVLAVLAGALLLLAAGGVAAWIRITAERDAARASLVALLTQRATSALSRGLRPDADLYAAEALRIAETPDARGALMAARSMPALTLLTSLDAGTTCTRLTLDAGVTCIGWDGVHRWDEGVRRDLAPKGTYTEASTLLRGQLALGGSTLQVELRDPATGAVDARLATGPVTALATSPDGALLYGARDGSVTRLDPGSGERHVLGTVGTAVAAIVAGTDVVFAADVQGMLHVLGEGVLASDHRAQVLALSPDGRWLAASGGFSGDPRLRLWDVGRRVEVPGPEVTGVEAFAWSADSRWLVAGDSEGVVRAWEAGSWRRALAVHAHAARVTALAFDADSGRLASADRDGTVRVWAMDGLRDAALVGRHPSGVDSLAFDPGGRSLLTWGEEGTARRWAWPGGGEEVRVDVRGARWGSAAWSSDGKRFAVTDGDEVRVFERDGTPATRLGLSLSVHDLLYLGDRIVVHPRTGTLQSLDVATGRILAEVTAPVSGAPGWDMVLAPDGNWLATADGDGFVRIFDRASLALRRALPTGSMAFSVDVSPDGRWLAAGVHDGDAVIWDTVAFAPTRLAGHDRACGAVAFSPDSRNLATGDADGTMRIWSVAELAVLAVLPAATTPINTLRFSPDGTHILSADADGDIRKWPLADLDADAEGVAAAVAEQFGMGLERDRVGVVGR